MEILAPPLSLDKIIEALAYNISSVRPNGSMVGVYKKPDIYVLYIYIYIIIYIIYIHIYIYMIIYIIYIHIYIYMCII